jgi:hypothetical protein
MRAVRFLPLVYFLGIHGFVLFAPYVALLLTASYTIRRLRTAPRLVPVTAPDTLKEIPLSPASALL